MKKYNKHNSILFWIYIIAGFALLLCGCEPEIKYIVEITYCDNREPKTIEYYSCMGEPNNSYIDNYKNAVPAFGGELNVCSIKVLGSSPVKR